MPEGEKILGVPLHLVMGGDNLPSPVGIGLADLSNMGGGDGSGPPAPYPLLCVEMGVYADISWESRCNIEKMSEFTFIRFC